MATTLIKDPIDEFFVQSHQYNQICYNLLDNQANMDDIETDFLDFYRNALHNIDQQYISTVSQYNVEKMLSESSMSIQELTQTIMEQIDEEEQQMQIKRVKSSKSQSNASNYMLNTQMIQESPAQHTKPSTEKQPEDSQSKVLLNLQSARSDYKKMLKERHNIETSSDNSRGSDNSSNSSNSHIVSLQNKLQDLQDSVKKINSNKKMENEQQEYQQQQLQQQHQQEQQRTQNMMDQYYKSAKSESTIKDEIIHSSPTPDNHINYQQSPSCTHISAHKKEQNEINVTTTTTNIDHSELTFKKPEFKPMSSLKKNKGQTGLNFNSIKNSLQKLDQEIQQMNKEPTSSGKKEKEDLVRKSLILKFEEAVHHSHSKDQNLLSLSENSASKRNSDLEEIITSLSKDSSNRGSNRSSSLFFTARNSISSLDFQPKVNLTTTNNNQQGNKIDFVTKEDFENSNSYSQNAMLNEQQHSQQQQQHHQKQQQSAINQDYIQNESNLMQIPQSQEFYQANHYLDQMFQNGYDPNEQYDLSDCSSEDGMQGYAFYEKYESLGGFESIPHNKKYSDEFISSSSEDLGANELPSENMVNSNLPQKMYFDFDKYVKEQQIKNENPNAYDLQMQRKKQTNNQTNSKIKRVYCNHKKVPLWAGSMQDVERVSQMQKRATNSDDIFGKFKVENMDLSVVFNREDPKFRRKRGSSAKWHHDDEEESHENSSKKARDLIRGMQYNLSTSKKINF